MNIQFKKEDKPFAYVDELLIRGGLNTAARRFVGIPRVIHRKLLWAGGCPPLIHTCR